MSDEIKTKNFVDIVRNFVSQMQNTIDTESGQDGLYKYVSELLKNLGEQIQEELPSFKDKAQKYYDTIKVEVDSKNIQKCVEELPKKVSEFEKQYTSWKDFCNKKIDELFDTEDKKQYAMLQGTLETSQGNARPDTLQAYKLLQANKDMQTEMKAYFKNNKHLIMLGECTNSPNELLTNQMAEQAKLSCLKVINEAKQLYKDFMVEYIKLTSDHIKNNDNKDSQEAFNDDNSLDLDRFYKNLGFTEDEIEYYIDKEEGIIKIPFRSVIAQVFQNQDKINIIDNDFGEKEIDIKKINEFLCTDRIKLYFALYVEQYKESVRINKNIEIFNTLISYTNNPHSLQYKIDTIKEVYNNIDLDEDQALEAYVKYNWEDIFNKTKEAGYWKEISDKDLPAFSEYLYQAVIDISKGLLDNMATKYTKIKFTKNTKDSFFKKRGGYYIVDLDCLEPVKNGLHIITRTELNDKAVMKAIEGSEKADSPFFIENIRGSIINGAWNGKYPVMQKIIKQVKEEGTEDIKEEIRDYKQALQIAFSRG